MKTRSEVMAERNTPEWERGANAEQLEMIRHETGPCRVLAAAGSGKTFGLTRRIVRLVRLNIVAEERILAMTFSKKAGDEMNKRLKGLGVNKASVGTWHSFCLKVLQGEGSKTKWSDWTIDGENDTPQRAKGILKDVIGYGGGRGMNWKGADISKVSSFIGRCKANLYEPSSSEALKEAERTFAWAAKTACEAFQRYNDALEEKGLLTFDDFLVFAVEHLRSSEEVRLSWANKFDQGLCDEVQDNNEAQNTLTMLLFADHGNYMAVGDCFQSIYGFRGSSPEYLANFDKEWPDAKTIWLPRNYRSGDKIIETANNIVRKAVIQGLEAKDMIPSRNVQGNVQVLCAEALDDEANEIVGMIEKSVKSNSSSFSDHTILYRTNAQSRALEEAFLKSKIPYIVVGGVSFYERREVRDLLAYLRLAANRARVEDVKRSINTPFRFLGAKFVERVMDEVDNRTVGLADWPSIVELVAAQERIQSRQRHSAHEWSMLIRGMQEDIAKAAREHATEDEKKAGSPAMLLEGVIRATKYITEIEAAEGNENVENSVGANVRELVRMAERFTTAAELLDYIDMTIRAAKVQRQDKQAGGERVLMMSIHRSKGLEWPNVYVAGCNEMILPHAKGDPEEERRLAYVAATRARDNLVLSFVSRIATRAGIRVAEPSRFVVDTGLYTPPGISAESLVAEQVTMAAIHESGEH